MIVQIKGRILEVSGGLIQISPLPYVITYEYPINLKEAIIAKEFIWKEDMTIFLYSVDGTTIAFLYKHTVQWFKQLKAAGFSLELIMAIQSGYNKDAFDKAIEHDQVILGFIDPKAKKFQSTITKYRVLDHKYDIDNLSKKEQVFLHLVSLGYDIKIIKEYALAVEKRYSKLFEQESIDEIVLLIMAYGITG